jgi:hypothetical protein
MQHRIESCANGCCHLVDGQIVTTAEYKAAVAAHPGSYPGLAPGQRNAIVEHQIACKGVRWKIRKVENRETQPMSSPGGQVIMSEIVDVPSAPIFRDDVEAKNHADSLGEGYVIAPTFAA